MAFALLLTSGLVETFATTDQPSYARLDTFGPSVLGFHFRLRSRFDDDGVRLRGSRLISPSSYRTEILAGNAAIFGVSGWWDGAYARAAAQRFNAAPTQGSQLLLGPWTHDGVWHIEQADRATRSRFDHDRRLLHFFNEHLRGDTTGRSGEPPVRYFTIIESKWKSAETWPPDAVCNRTFF